MAPRPRGSYSAAQQSLSRDEYLARVARTQEYIAAGDVYQLVLSARFSGQHDLDPFQAYRALRLINPFSLYVLPQARRAHSGRLLPRRW